MDNNNSKNIDIREDYLFKKDNLLEILLQDKTDGLKAIFDDLK